MDRMPDADSLPFWLALLYAPGIGPIHYQRILQIFPDPGELFQAEFPELNADSALPDKLKDYLRNPDWKLVDRHLNWASQTQCHIITLADGRYPQLLKQTPGAPPLLFVRGNAGILNNPQLAMVGSRNPTGGGMHNATQFAAGLAQRGLTITSGLATGIDAASHRGALQAGGLTIAVAGTGLDRIYPGANRKLGELIIEQGAILSEFPPGTAPLAANFPRRNRIISGLCLGTLVVEAALASGSLITARLAVEQGREVFAIPGSIHNPLARGCHALLRQGAKLTESIDDILDELPAQAWSPGHVSTASDSSSRHAVQADAASQTLLSSLGHDPSSIDLLVSRSGLTPEAVSSMLVSLELQGRVTCTGGLYCRID